MYVYVSLYVYICMCPLGLGEATGSLREEVIGGDKVSGWELNPVLCTRSHWAIFQGPSLFFKCHCLMEKCMTVPSWQDPRKEGQWVGYKRAHPVGGGSPAQSRKSDRHKKDRGQIAAVLITCKPCSLTVHSALCCSSFRIDVFVLTCTPVKRRHLEQWQSTWNFGFKANLGLGTEL